MPTFNQFHVARVEEYGAVLLDVLGHVQGLLEGVSDAFTVNYHFIDSVKAYLCYALLRSFLSPTASVFQVFKEISTDLYCFEFSIFRLHRCT